MERGHKKITVRLPENYLKEIDFLVKIDDFPSRSEAVRTAIRDLLNDRVPMVIEKVEKKVEARRRITEMEELEKEYLQK